MEFLINFGRNVKKYRELCQLSQEEFAYRLSINFSNISRIESGKQFVTADTLEAITEILGVTVNQLFEKNFEEKQKEPETGIKIKLMNYISAMSEEDAKYIFENSKLYMKYKIKQNFKNQPPI